MKSFLKIAKKIFEILTKTNSSKIVHQRFSTKKNHHKKKNPLDPRLFIINFNRKNSFQHVITKTTINNWTVNKVVIPKNERLKMNGSFFVIITKKACRFKSVFYFTWNKRENKIALIEK